MFIKMLDETKEKFPPKYTKIYPKILQLFCIQCPPCSVLSPCISQFSVKSFCYYISQSKYVWYFYYCIFQSEDIAWNFFCYNFLSNEPTNCWFCSWCYSTFYSCQVDDGFWNNLFNAEMPKHNIVWKPFMVGKHLMLSMSTLCWVMFFLICKNAHLQLI